MPISRPRPGSGHPDLLSMIATSVADPDPYVFGSSGSGSVSHSMDPAPDSDPSMIKQK
jgi:hypothetical protein